MNMKKILYSVIIIVLVAVFGVSAFLVGSYVVNSKKENDRYAQLAVTPSTSEAPAAPETQPESKPEETTAAVTEPQEPTEPQILDAYLEKYNENNDMVGQIWIENTKLNYPVMQTPNEKDYYLKRNFDKQKSDWGAIYAWEKADINEPSDNITLFGHNMKDGSMFAALNAYKEKKAWDENPWIFFDTLYESHAYKIFAVFKTTAEEGVGFPYHRFVDAANEAEFDEFVKNCKRLSFYETDITPKYGDKLICLSTCEYTDPFGNGRFVVAAVRWF